MRNKILSFILTLSLVLGPASIVVVTTLGCVAVMPGQDAVVVRTEQTLDGAVDTLDILFKYEKDNRAVLGPTFKQKVDNLRRNAPPAIDTVKLALKGYKQNRTPDKKATLESALAVLQVLASQAAQLAVPTTVTPPPPTIGDPPQPPSP